MEAALPLPGPVRRPGDRLLRYSYPAMLAVVEGDFTGVRRRRKTLSQGEIGERVRQRRRPPAPR